MKEYDLYLPVEPRNAPAAIPDQIVWLREQLRERFGSYQELAGFHQGSWNTSAVDYHGPVQLFTVCSEETQARSFFARLKKALQDRGCHQVMILEKEAAGPKGEMVGERI